VQVGELAYLSVVEGAAFALSLGRLAGEPHVVVGDELPAAFERLQQRDRPVRADQGDRGVDLDHRQPPPGRGDRVALVGVRLFPNPQGVDFGLPGGAVDHRR
jgi:hypothetical protein